MRGYRQFQEDDVQKVARLHSQGYSKNDIALSTRLPLHVIWYILYKRLKVSKGKRIYSARITAERRLDEKTINKIIVLTNFGYQYREIAEDQQIPEPLVREVVAKAKEKKLIEKKC
jgi:hypothetical protein